MDKKYLFFIGTLNQGGGERVISILTKKMKEDGLPVEILIYHDADPFYELHPGVKLTRVRAETGSGNLLKNLLWMRRYFRENAKAVISFLAPFNMLTLVATAFMKLPVIVADRNDPRFIPGKPLLRKLRNFLYRFADGVVLQTRYNQQYFSKAVQKKSTIIYNPIDLGEKAGLALRTDKKKRIVSVGRLMPQKNQKMLLEAFARLRQQFPDYTLTIYGEGPARQDLEAHIAQLGLTGAVELPGSVKNVHDQIADAELFVLPSDFEGMPNALIEAMCLGLPVISTKVSGATDLIDGENGLLTEVGDTEGLYTAMQQMLIDNDMRRNCAEKATLLNDRLQVERILAQWMQFIETMEEGRHNGNEAHD